MTNSLSTSASNATVFIVDADAQVRARMGDVIRGAGWLVETFDSPAAYFSRLPSYAPSCLVLEVDIPELGASDLVRRIVAERPETPVIAMTSHGDIPLIVRTMKAGAVELLMKPPAEDVLRSAVGQAIACSRAVLGDAAERRELGRRYDLLSGRERDVLARVVSGRLNKQIGMSLGISEITVKAHRGRVMRKMGADSLADLVVIAMHLDLRREPITRPPLSAVRVLRTAVFRSTAPERARVREGVRERLRESAAS